MFPPFSLILYRSRIRFIFPVWFPRNCERTPKNKKPSCYNKYYVFVKSFIFSLIGLLLKSKPHLATPVFFIPPPPFANFFFFFFVYLKESEDEKLLEFPRIFFRFLPISLQPNRGSRKLSDCERMLGTASQFGQVRGEDRFYIPVKARRNQNHRQRQQQQKQEQQPNKTNKSEDKGNSPSSKIKVFGTDNRNNTKENSSITSVPASEPPLLSHSNLDRFLESTTPSVPAQYLSKVDFCCLF